MGIDVLLDHVSRDICLFLEQFRFVATVSQPAGVLGDWGGIMKTSHSCFS